MERVKDWTTGLAWPDISTDEGLSRATSIGAAAQIAVALTYAAAFVSLLGGGPLVGGDSDDGGTLRPLALVALGGAVPATIYVAYRIWAQRCGVAAWLGFVWIGYENLSSMLGITLGHPLVLLILLFAAFQGVRACPFPVLKGH
jgi:hypothetical protein